MQLKALGDHNIWKSILFFHLADNSLESVVIKIKLYVLIALPLLLNWRKSYIGLILYGTCKQKSHTERYPFAPSLFCFRPPFPFYPFRKDRKRIRLFLQQLHTGTSKNIQNNHELNTLKLHITSSFYFFSQEFGYFSCFVFSFILLNDVSCKRKTRSCM